MSHEHSPDLANRVRRGDVWQTVACPECGAPAGQRCIGARGQRRYASHAARWDARRQAAKPAPELALRESDIEAHLVERVKALGGEVRKLKWVGRNSAPDRFVMLPGRRSFWLELKNPRTILTFPADARERAQAREHKRMRELDELVHVAGTYEQVEALLA